jgi:type II secretory pathway pseudopilin PulG
MGQRAKFIDGYSGARRMRGARRATAAGMTLIELILACSILLILTSAAMPIMRYTIVHKREQELHYDLRQMRDAIDRYKDLADRLRRWSRAFSWAPGMIARFASCARFRRIR